LSRLGSLVCGHKSLSRVLFGLAVQILAEEAVREPRRGAASDTERRLARVG